MNQGVVTTYAVPGRLGGAAAGITLGPDGHLWIAGTMAIGRVSVTGKVKAFPVPAYAFGDITTGPDGNLWFTQSNANEIGRMTTAGTVTEFPIPTGGAGPLGIASGPDGNLWFTEGATHKIGRLTPGCSFTEFPLPSTSYPGRISPARTGTCGSPRTT